MATLARRGIPFSVAAIGAALAVLLAGTLAHIGVAAAIPALVVLGCLLLPAAARLAMSWPRLIFGVALVALLIPNDGRYTIGGGLPIQLEPYRVVVGLLLIGWLAALLVDRRVQLRATGLEGPLALIVVATLGSELLNASRVDSVASNVVKSLWLFFSFILFLYLVVSVIRSRAVVERLIVILVSAGSLVAIAALLQRRTGISPFDHWRILLPFLRYDGSAELALTRGGDIRAIASAGHPIELGNSMAMLVPLAAYLGITRGQRRWWGAGALLLVGSFASGSRTGIISLLAILAVFVWLRPRQTLRCWPAIVPVAVAVHLFVPHAIGGMIEGFFPREGLIAQQTTVERGPGGSVRYNTRLSRVGPELQAFSDRNDPLFGEGYGTRVVGRTNHDNANVLDDQWLGTLVETGVLGVLGWMSLFATVIWRLGARAKLDRDSPDGWLAVAIAAAVAGFATTMFTYDAFGFIQAVLIVHLLIACAAILLRLPASEKAHPAGDASVGLA